MSVMCTFKALVVPPKLSYGSLQLMFFLPIVCCTTRRDVTHNPDYVDNDEMETPQSQYNDPSHPNTHWRNNQEHPESDLHKPKNDDKGSIEPVKPLPTYAVGGSLSIFLDVGTTRNKITV